MIGTSDKVNEEVFDLMTDYLDRPLQSNYVSVDNFNETVPTFPHFTTVCFNIRSFRANFTMFDAFLGSLGHMPDVLALTETWNDMESVTLNNIPGYSCFHSIRMNRPGGGVSVYVSDLLSSFKLEPLCINNETVESCAVEVSGDNSTDSFVIFCIYRPHTDSPVNFTDRIVELMQSDLLRGKKIILLGDFNIDLLNVSGGSNYFSMALCSLSFMPSITKPTRFASSNDTSASLLDHIWINFHDFHDSGVFICDITDHCPVYFRFRRLVSSSVERKEVEISFRLHNNANIRRFRDVLTDFRWEFCTDVNTAVSYFLSTVNRIYCQHFPLVTKAVSAKRLKKPWISRDVIQKVKLKSTYFKMYRSGDIDYSSYRKLRNDATKYIRCARSAYMKRRFEACRTDMAKSWRLVNDLLGGVKDRRVIGSVMRGTSELTEVSDIAEHFCSYFSSVANELDCSIPSSHDSPSEFIVRGQLESFFVRPVSAQECSRMIKNLKKTKCDVNSLPVTIMKQLHDILCFPISELINLSFTKAEFPDVLKEATVVPVFKRGDCKVVSNYRPISILPVLSKLFERAFADRLVDFCGKFGILSVRQFGFRKGTSSQDAISDLLEYIYDGLDEKEHVASVLLDLSKAFDTVNHGILLEKLAIYGIRGLPLNWIADYLSDRFQSVRVGSYLSRARPITIGVPQGSILGPLLFLLYINDLALVSPVCSTLLFADDTTLSYRHNDLDVVMVNLRSELNKVLKWSQSNRLSINAGKTKCILFSNRTTALPPEHGIVMDNVRLKGVDCCELLGMELDSSLKFDCHVRKVSLKISRVCGMLYRLKNDLPTDRLISLYYAMAYPHFIYCCILWGGASGIYVRVLETLQKRLVRILAGESYLAPTGPIFKKYKILRFRDIYCFQLCAYSYKMINRSVMPLTNHVYGTRNRFCAKSRFRRLASSQRSLSYAAPDAWNSLPYEIRNSTSLNIFKKRLKSHIVGNYS